MINTIKSFGRTTEYQWSKCISQFSTSFFLANRIKS